MRVEQAGAGASGHLIKALILDDDDFDRRRICRMGAASGLEMNVVSVPTIEQMRSTLDDDVFDLIFLDYRLSNETGLDALEHIQSHKTNAEAAMIMLTGHLKVEVAVAALKNGCQDYINKDDLNPDLLRETVEAVMARKKEKRAAPVVSEDMLDRAIYDMARTRLPELFAYVLSSQSVQQVVAPLFQDAMKKGLEFVSV